MSPTREGTRTLSADERATARLRLLHAATGNPAPTRYQRRLAERRAAAAAGRARREVQNMGWDDIDSSAHEDRA